MMLLGWRYEQNRQIKFRAENIPQKRQFMSFLAITIPVRQIQMILLIIPFQNEHVGMWISSKHPNFIQSGIYSSKTYIFVILGFNSCSASNCFTFNTHTPAKWCCWDGDMSKTVKLNSERKTFLKIVNLCRFWL